MAMKQFRLVATVLSLLVSGAVADGARLPQYVKTIGIIPVLPTTGHLYHVALLRFGNQCQPFDLRGANLEAATYSAASSVLSRYKLVRLSAPPGSVIHTRGEPYGIFKSYPPIGEQLSQMARPQVPVDVYLLVWAEQAHSDCLNIPRPYGIGVTKRIVIAGDEITVHGFGRVILIDAHTNEELSSVILRAQALLPGFEWKDKDKPAEVSANQVTMINTSLRNVFGAAVADEIRRLLPSQ
jgi:hypothetical protein